MKAAKRPGNRRRMAVFVSLLLLGFSPALLIAGASFHFRHRPYTIPPEQRAPAPPVRAIGGLKLRWLGVTGYVLSDGKTTLVLDPAMSRYRLTRLLSGPIDTEPKRVQKLVPKADFILINHSHYDHIIDLPEIAKRTGATVVGSPRPLIWPAPAGFQRASSGWRNAETPSNSGAFRSTSDVATTPRLPASVSRCPA